MQSHLNEFEIRYPVKSDAQDIKEIALEFNTENSIWLPDWLLSNSFTYVDNWIMDAYTEREGRCSFRFVVLNKTNAQLIGCIWVNKINWDKKSAMIGYFISPSWQGLGGATMALHLVVKFAKKLNLKNVYLDVEIGNAGSIKVIENNYGTLIYETNIYHDKTPYLAYRYQININ